MEIKKVKPGYILAYWDNEGDSFEVCEWNRIHRAIDKDNGKLAYYLYIRKGENVIVKRNGKQIMYVCE